MAWDEWEQAKAAVAARQSAHVHLDSVPMDPGGSSGNLVSNKPAWSKAGQDVGSFHTDISKALSRLSEGQAGLGTDAGCQTAGAQKDVHDSWARYVKSVSGRCEKLAGLLAKAGNDQLKTDESIMAEIGNLKVEYGDTPAVGGHEER